MIETRPEIHPLERELRELRKRLEEGAFLLHVFSSDGSDRWEVSSSSGREEVDPYHAAELVRCRIATPVSGGPIGNEWRVLYEVRHGFQETPAWKSRREALSLVQLRPRIEFNYENCVWEASYGGAAHFWLGTGPEDVVQRMVDDLVSEIEADA